MIRLHATAATRFSTDAKFAFVLFLCFALSLAANTKKKPPATPLDLNTATLAQLEELPGIGASTANAIVQFRNKSGPFRRVEDLLAIRGISSHKLAQLRPYVSITPSNFAHP